MCRPGNQHSLAPDLSVKFNIAVIDPKGFPWTHFLFDTCKLICYGLEELGHDCTIRQNNLEPSRLNIIVGGHHLASAEHVLQIAKIGDYIVFQTEIIKEDTVNLTNTREHFENVYLPLLQRAKSVWEGASTNLRALEGFGVRTQTYVGGYVAAMEEIVHKRNKDVDFLFYGSITPHRREMLEKLKASGCSLVTEFDIQPFYRNDLIARSKLVLSPRQGDVMNQLPYGRICYLLNNRMPVVVEKCLEQEWLQDCFYWGETEEWVDLCLETLHRPDLAAATAEMFERYKKLRFADQLQQLLEGL